MKNGLETELFQDALDEIEIVMSPIGPPDRLRCVDLGPPGMSAVPSKDASSTIISSRSLIVCRSVLSIA
jgi:hypothetical protein